DGPGPPGDDQSPAPDGIRRPGYIPPPETGRPGDGITRRSAAIPTRTPPRPPPKKPGIPKPDEGLMGERTALPHLWGSTRRSRGMGLNQEELWSGGAV